MFSRKAGHASAAATSNSSRITEYAAPKSRSPRGRMADALHAVELAVQVGQARLAVLDRARIGERARLQEREQRRAPVGRAAGEEEGCGRAVEALLERSEGREHALQLARV